ncbi:MAG: anhydro-N-acetylmuramic acid kinase [Neisseria sp.]|nr:anhydro-N-acetylmuramic acid kinase [Neisseria sp.]
MAQDFQYYIGIMSGTSMDGADAVLIRMRGAEWLGAEAHAFTPYPDDLKAELLALQNSGEDEIHRSRLLSQRLSRLYAETVHKLLAENSLMPSEITAVGCHGQTVRHAPEHGYSVQLADWPLLAELCGILTVGDFRSRDLAAGGQGAPLVPAFHQALFSAPHETRVLLNIGGIANISILRPSENERSEFLRSKNEAHAELLHSKNETSEIFLHNKTSENQGAIGFDTGPGNMLMDAWMQKAFGLPYDKNGETASRGRVLPELLARLLDNGYFRRLPPKSTGRELFALPYLLDRLNGDEAPEDVLRTLTEFTAQTAVDEIVRNAPDTQQIYVCGGGIRNAVLMNALDTLLAERLPDAALHSTAALNLDPQWMEAAAFAWLAACWVNRIPSNPHHATGASKPCILGTGCYA